MNIFRFFKKKTLEEIALSRLEIRKCKCGAKFFPNNSRNIKCVKCSGDSTRYAKYE